MSVWRARPTGPREDVSDPGRYLWEQDPPSIRVGRPIYPRTWWNRLLLWRHTVEDLLGGGSMTANPNPSRRSRALMLTQQEWDDLAEMVDHFLLVTNWIVNPHHHTDPPTHIEKVKRQRALAERIIEANQ